MVVYFQSKQVVTPKNRANAAFNANVLFTLFRHIFVELPS